MDPESRVNIWALSRVLMSRDRRTMSSKEYNLKKKIINFQMGCLSQLELLGKQ